MIVMVVQTLWLSKKVMKDIEMSCIGMRSQNHGVCFQYGRSTAWGRLMMSLHVNHAGRRNKLMFLEPYLRFISQRVWNIWIIAIFPFVPGAGIAWKVEAGSSDIATRRG